MFKENMRQVLARSRYLYPGKVFKIEISVSILVRSGVMGLGSLRTICLRSSLAQADAPSARFCLPVRHAICRWRFMFASVVFRSLFKSDYLIT